MCCSWWAVVNRSSTLRVAAERARGAVRSHGQSAMPPQRQPVAGCGYLECLLVLWEETIFALPFGKTTPRLCLAPLKGEGISQVA